MPDVLELDGVTCRYPGAPTAAPALADVSLTVPAGTFVAVAGPTGSGKSTLLSCAAGLERVSTGRVRLLGHDLTRLGERASSRLRRDDVGVVFQAYDLLSELTVGQNVLLPCRLGAARRRDLGEVLASAVERGETTNDILRLPTWPAKLVLLVSFAAFFVVAVWKELLTFAAIRDGELRS